VAKARHALLALLLLAPLRLRASLSDAKAAYLKGLKFEIAKDYDSAIAAYDDCLDAYPTYVFAHRELANCDYYLGRLNDAAKECAIYLTVHPEDEQVQAFAKRLSESGAGGTDTGIIPELPDPYADTPFLGFALGEVDVENSDVQELSPGASFLQDTGVLSELRLGWLWADGFWLEGIYSDGPNRDYSVPAGQGSSSFNLALGEWSLGIEPGFRFPMGRNVSLGGGLEVGYAWDNLDYSSAATQGQYYSGSGFCYTPELKLALALGHLGLSINGGFHTARITPLKDASGYPLTVADLGTGESVNWTMDNSGYFLSLELDYYLHAPMLKQSWGP
jgi:tetratricopeptide (TPR) repeat protein